jgi:hypothetical protein
MKNTKIHNISFQVHENMGIRTLVCIEPDLQLINQFIQIVAQDPTVYNIINGRKPYTWEFLKVRFVEDHDSSTKLHTLFSDFKYQNKPFYLLEEQLSDSSEYLLVPLEFLNEIIVKISELKKDSKPVQPPWLFCENPKHSAPCRLQEFDNLEENLLKDLNRELINNNLSVKELDHELFNKSKSGKQQPVEAKLEKLGLLSEKSKDLKLYWLAAFNCNKLYELYEEILQRKSQNEPGKQNIDQPLINEIRLIEKQLTDLNNNIKLKKWNKVGRCNAIRQLYGLFESNNLFKTDRFDNSEWVNSYNKYPLSMQMLQNLKLFHSYLTGTYRKSNLAQTTLNDMSKLPFSLFWFFRISFPHEYQPEEWLSICENLYIREEITEPGMYFIKIPDIKIQFIVDYDDGINLKILSANLVNTD